MKNIIQTDYLSKSNTNALKGYLAMGVLVHHLYQSSGLLRGTWVGAIFQIMGYLCVSVFFFLSGYGLMESYLKSEENYIKRFPRKRILSFYCNCIILILLYLVVAIVLGRNVDINSVISSFFFGKTIIANGWYLQAILLSYLAFWISFRTFRTINGKVNGMFIFCVFYCLLCEILELSDTWWVCQFSIVLGMIWSMHKKKIDNCLTHIKEWLFTFGCATIVFGFFLIISKLGEPSIIISLAKMISALSFVVIIILLIMKINIVNTISVFWGTISFEIYVIQGLFITIFRSDFYYVQNPFLFVVLVIGGTILFSIIIHPVFKCINGKVGKASSTLR